MKPSQFMPELYATLAAVEDGRLCAEWIVEELTGIPRLNLSMGGGRALSDEQVQQARAWAARAAGGEPIQYVLGWTSFRGHRIRTDRRALIPRPETEELVSCVRAGLSGPARIADVGTGTGCIAIALCLETAGVTVRAIDREPEALALAAENVGAHRLDARIELVEADLLEGVAARALDVVVSNPPYVAETELVDLPRNVRDFEPVSALVSGADGLDVIRRLVPQARHGLKPGGRLYLEIAESQADAVTDFMRDAGFADVRIATDLAGRDRIAHAISP